MTSDDTKNYLVFGGVAVAALLIVAVFGRSTSSGYVVDPNAAKAEEAIVAGNSNAINAGVNERVALAQIAANVVNAHDANTTALAIAANNGATQEQLATIAANATVASSNLQTQAAEAIATTNANLNRDISNNNATSVQRSAGASKFDSVMQVIKSAIPFFSGSTSNPYPTTPTDIYSNDLPPVFTPPDSMFAPVSFGNNTLSGTPQYGFGNFAA